MALMDSTTSNKELRGDGQDVAMESFELCKRTDEETNEDGIHKSCKYKDAYGRCIFENCIYDEQDIPKPARRWWYHCVICDKVTSVNPKHVKAMICDTCQKRMWKAEKLPFTCINCGTSQNHPSIIMFSRICDNCVKTRLFNNTCLRFLPGGGIGGGGLGDLSPSTPNLDTITSIEQC